jgi:hypothetical protein
MAAGLSLRTSGAGAADTLIARGNEDGAVTLMEIVDSWAADMAASVGAKALSCRAGAYAAAPGAELSCDGRPQARSLPREEPGKLLDHPEA